jgi:coproporphyrinogen III oxidase
MFFGFLGPCYIPLMTKKPTLESLLSDHKLVARFNAEVDGRKPGAPPGGMKQMIDGQIAEEASVSIFRVFGAVIPNIEERVQQLHNIKSLPRFRRKLVKLLVDVYLIEHHTAKK